MHRSSEKWKDSRHQQTHKALHGSASYQGAQDTLRPNHEPRKVKASKSGLLGLQSAKCFYRQFLEPSLYIGVRIILGDHLKRNARPILLQDANEHEWLLLLFTLHVFAKTWPRPMHLIPVLSAPGIRPDHHQPTPGEKRWVGTIFLTAFKAFMLSVLQTTIWRVRCCRPDSVAEQDWHQDWPKIGCTCPLAHA